MLQLANNSLSGGLPFKLRLPANLSELVLSGNSLSGTLAKDWDLGFNLRVLHLYDNKLTGTIPPLKLPPGLQVGG